MVWIYACRRVAFMQYPKPFGDWPFMKFPRDSVGAQLAAVFDAIPDQAIAVII